MKKIILTICFCLITSISFGAEFLVIQKSGSHYTHAKAGDIVAVRPDGHKWGKKECLPLFKVVKKPEMKYEDAKVYEQSLTEEVDVENAGVFTKEQKVVRDRKYYFDGDAIKAKVLLTEKTKVVNEKSLLIDIKVLDAR